VKTGVPEICGLIEPAVFEGRNPFELTSGKIDILVKNHIVGMFFSIVMIISEYIVFEYTVDEG
jgi:hypothetical protein